MFMSEKTPGNRVFRVIALVHPRILSTSVTLPLEILRAATQSQAAAPRLRATLHAGPEDTGLELGDGLHFHTHPIPDALDADLVLVPAIWRNPRWVLSHYPQHVNAIDRAIASGSTVCAVGSGSFLAAATGCLDGKHATTHWHWFDAFEQRFPQVTLRRDQLITQADSVFCAGSVNSIADLMVYLVSRWFSSNTARRVQNQFSPEIRQPFAPSTLPGVVAEHGDELVHDIQLQMSEHLRDLPPVTDLAARNGVSVRTLDRRFRRATGLSPGRYLRRLRLSEARALLQHSNLAIGEIAWSVGFNDRSRFAAEFRKDYGVTPRRFREAVRGKTFSIPEAMA